MIRTTVKTITVTLPGDTLEVDTDEGQRIEIVESRPYDSTSTTWTYQLYTYTEVDD